ncbi:MAG: AraC family transcriptional regulator [Dongiaceae bacterium]
MRVVRQSFALGEWESVFCAPDPRLHGLVIGDYHGWTEASSTGMCQTEAPKMLVPFVINLGPAFDIDSPGNLSAALEPYDSFVAGLHNRYALVRSSGRSQCLQVNFTLIGAWRLFGVAMHEIANRIVSIEDLVGDEGRVAIDRIRMASGWPERFEILDDFLLKRLGGAAVVPHRIDRALHRLKTTGGAVGIGALADELDCSCKQLIRLFDDTVGLPPKIVARIYRFERAVRRLGAPSRPALSELALECGYYDQAHFNREFRAFVGCAPGEYRHLVAAG